MTENLMFEWASSPVGMTASAVTILGAVIAVVQFILKPWRKRQERLNWLQDNFPEGSRTIRQGYYIETRGQDTDPCIHGEIREDNGLSASVPLVDFFLNTAFSPSSFGQFYLVLGDSGMGKTTFLLRLHLVYGGLKGKKKTIAFVSLSDGDCLSNIEKIERKENTILLLDALDENREAMQDTEAFLKKLLEAAEKFYRIVITCRTQFFPDEEHEPKKTHLIRKDVGNKNVTISKKYISPFSDEEVQQYLERRYFDNAKIRNQAMQIIERVPSLAARPLILSWMDDLCEDKTCDYQYRCQIYEKIIRNWDKRELEEHLHGKLYAFSLLVAKEMMRRDALELPAEVVDALAEKEDIQLEPIIAKSRTLLNRNTDGIWKFAHRSFYEYLASVLILCHYEDWMEAKIQTISENTLMFIKEQFPLCQAKEVLLKTVSFLKFNLQGANLWESDLRGADLRDANLQDTILLNADLRGADLRGADLRSAKLVGADLRDANLRGADLLNADLRNADLRDADLRDAIYDSLKNAFTNRFTKF